MTNNNIILSSCVKDAKRCGRSVDLVSLFRKLSRNILLSRSPRDRKMGRGNLAANTEGPQSLECARARGEDRRSEVGPPTNISLCGGFFPQNKITMVSGKDYVD